MILYTAFHVTSIECKQVVYLYATDGLEKSDALQKSSQTLLQMFMLWCSLGYYILASRPEAFSETVIYTAGSTRFIQFLVNVNITASL